MVDVNKLRARYESLRTERSGWDSAWQELAELFLPCRWRSDTDTTAHKAPQLNGRLMNSAGVLAMRTLASGMQGGMTSPVRPWFRLTVKGMKDGDVPPSLAGWLDEVTASMQALLHQSNFYNAVHGLYGDLGTFGTALLVETANEDGLQFSLVRAGEYVIDVNGSNQVDTFFRRISMTARQIIDKFGDAVPEAIRLQASASSSASSITRYDVIHAVFPNKYRDGEYDKPFVSIYFCLDAGFKDNILSEGGYEMFPAFAPRWDVNGTDVYGRSPAMDITPDCKMLQAMTKTLRVMQHKIADPPMIAAGYMRSYRVDLNPGAINYADMGNAVDGGTQPIVPIQQPDANALKFTMESIARIEQLVSVGLYSDLFRMLIDIDRRNITATEVNAKMQEKMVLIGPVVERLHKELLEPVIMRTYGLMREWNALPPVPEDIDIAQLDVTFESVLAQAQKLSATSAIDQGLAFFGNVAKVNPEVLDILNTDNLTRTYMDRIGMPATCLANEDEIKKKRLARKQQQQMAQQLQAQQAQAKTFANIAGAGKDIAQIPTDNSLMGALLEGVKR